MPLLSASVKQEHTVALNLLSAIFLIDSCFESSEKDYYSIKNL